MISRVSTVQNSNIRTTHFHLFPDYAKVFLRPADLRNDEPEKGKPSERMGRKATGLRPAQAG
jgi:hypothetical protein